MLALMARHRFTQEEVDAIRSGAPGYRLSQRHLAAKFGVSDSAISNLMLNKTYVDRSLHVGREASLSEDDEVEED